MSEKKSVEVRELTDIELINKLSEMAQKQIEKDTLTASARKQLLDAMNTLKFVLKRDKKTVKEICVDLGGKCKDLAIKSKDVLVNVKDSAQFKLNSFKKTRKQKKKVKLQRKLEKYET